MDCESIADTCKGCEEKGILIAKYARLVGLLKHRKGVDDSRNSKLAESTQEQSRLAASKGQGIVAVLPRLVAKKMREGFERLRDEGKGKDYTQGN